jgi:hypothetical protein
MKNQSSNAWIAIVAIVVTFFLFEMNFGNKRTVTGLLTSKVHHHNRHTTTPMFIVRLKDRDTVRIPISYDLWGDIKEGDEVVLSEKTTPVFGWRRYSIK